MEYILNHIPDLGIGTVVMLIIIALYLQNKSTIKSDAGRQINMDSFNMFNNSLMRRLDKLEEVVEQLRKDNQQLKIDNESLRTQLAIMESAHQDAPIPMWLKDKEGIMLAVNRAYETEFLKPIGKQISDYVGHKDHDIWPDEIADAFVVNDGVVIAKKEVWIGVEMIMDQNGDFNPYGIMKYPRMEGSFLIGIAGIAIPQELLNTIIGADK